MYDTYVLHEVTASMRRDASKHDGQSCVLLHCNAVNRRAVTKRTDKILHVLARPGVPYLTL